MTRVCVNVGLVSFVVRNVVVVHRPELPFDVHVVPLAEVSEHLDVRDVVDGHPDLELCGLQDVGLLRKLVPGGTKLDPKPDDARLPLAGRLPILPCELQRLDRRRLGGRPVRQQPRPGRCTGWHGLHRLGVHPPAVLVIDLPLGLDHGDIFRGYRLHQKVIDVAQFSENAPAHDEMAVLHIDLHRSDGKIVEHHALMLQLQGQVSGTR
mmetsp:Transcript_79981/g.232210  ORF Transcript_79981/g.232210 Transcript_79981/m.232210 type:complete len:208 (-) Transcript_79981:745-1368(-)